MLKGLGKLNRRAPYIYIYIYIGCAALSLFLVNSASASEIITTSVGVNPSLTLTIPTEPLNLNLNPASSTFGYQDLPIRVGTNNPTGYKLTISTANDNTNLTNAENSTTIPTLSTTSASGYTDATFEINTWGYKNGLSNNYFPFVSGSIVLESASAANDDTTTLRFASKIDYLQPEGTYSTTFSFNIIANPICDTTITGVMQTFSPCPDMAIGTSGTLKDLRDNKVYTVAKLADGRIWMTSNLNLAGGTKLYSETSNVPAGYPESAGVGYYTLPNSSSSGFSSDTTAYVYNTGNETTTQTSAANNSYYSWLAATAGGKDADGNAVTGNGPDTAYSVCPKNWRLPKSGNQSDTSATSTTGYKKGDFYKLATAYGANLESSYYQNSAVFYQNAGPNTLPNFLLAGYYYSSSFRYGGTYGNYWSSSSYSSTYAYVLSFDSSYVNSADYNNRRRLGFSVRCVFAGV